MKNHIHKHRGIDSKCQYCLDKEIQTDFVIIDLDKDGNMKYINVEKIFQSKTIDQNKVRKKSRKTIDQNKGRADLLVKTKQDY